VAWDEVADDQEALAGMACREVALTGMACCQEALATRAFRQKALGEEGPTSGGLGWMAQSEES
jgi:hypothetical protein